MIIRRVPFVVRLAVPVLDVRTRQGEFLEGAAGWGEYSPLPSWSPEELVKARSAAAEAAEEPFPEPVRNRVAVNVMVPRLPPLEAARLALASGCRTVKVKVGDPAGLDRVAAVRDAVGERGRIRLDANGAWTDADEALRELARFAPYGIELVEDPVADIAALAEIRRRQPLLIAADAVVRTPEDVVAVRDADAADVLVLKPQRFGGIRACLDAAEAWGGPVVASSALETSVGLCAVLALAAALPDAPFAHGIATALLLAEDPCEARLSPIGGSLVPRRIAPDLAAVHSPR